MTEGVPTSKKFLIIRCLLWNMWCTLAVYILRSQPLVVYSLLPGNSLGNNAIYSVARQCKYSVAKDLLIPVYAHYDRIGMERNTSVLLGNVRTYVT